MITSQVLTYSGDLESYIGSDGDLDEFRSPLAVMNGVDNFSLNLMHMPTPKWPEDLTRSEIEEMGRSYLQCAGSADAMTCEISRVIDGVQKLFTIGHPGPKQGEPSVPIVYHRGELTLYIYPTEVFEADEAAELFLAYHRTRNIPAGYDLRWIGP